MLGGVLLQRRDRFRREGELDLGRHRCWGRGASETLVQRAPERDGLPKAGSEAGRCGGETPRETEALKRVGPRVDTRSSSSLYFKTLTQDMLDRHTDGEKWGRLGRGRGRPLS